MNINRINTIAVVCMSAITLGLGSCGKSFLDTRLDTQPTQKNVDENYATLIQLSGAAYGKLQGYNEFSILDGNLIAPITDEAVATTPKNAYLFNNGSWNQFNNPLDYYNFYYAGIYTVNYFLKYLQDHGGDYRQLLARNRDTLSPASRSNYLQDVTLMGWSVAEMYIVRAYYYFELIKRYGGVPLLTTIDASGVKTAAYDDVVNFIVSEIDGHKDDLQRNWKTSNFQNQIGRYSLGSALALKARVLLYAASPLHNPGGNAAKWQAAAAAASDAVIFAQGTGATGGQNILATDYQNYFLANNMVDPSTALSKETILAVGFGNSNSLETANYPVGTAGGSSGVTPTEDLVEDYEYTGVPDPGNPYANRDPRLGYSIVTNGSNWNNRIIDETPGGPDDMTRAKASKTGYYLKKFLPANLNLLNGGTAAHNWPLFRYGELLLEYAEVMNEAYGPDNNNGFPLTARQALNMVRARPGVNMPAVIAAGQNDFRNAVKHERRIELAFEGHRYWDLLRWNDAATVLNQPVRGVQITQSGSAAVYMPRVVQNRVFIAPKMYLFPFPQTEVAISGGAVQQNPGW